MSICTRLVLSILVAFALQGAGAAGGGDFEMRVNGNAAVSNHAAGNVKETPDDTLDYRVAEADALVSRSMIAVSALRADGKIEDYEWPCVKKTLDRASVDIDAARAAYNADNPAVAMYLADRIQRDLSQINAEVQE